MNQPAFFAQTRVTMQALPLPKTMWWWAGNSNHITFWTQALLIWAAILAVIMSVLLLQHGPLKLMRMTFFLLLYVGAAAMFSVYHDLTLGLINLNGLSAFSHLLFLLSAILAAVMSWLLITRGPIMLMRWTLFTLLFVATSATLLMYHRLTLF